jgi:hypothetical protein
MKECVVVFRAMGALPSGLYYSPEFATYELAEQWIESEFKRLNFCNPEVLAVFQIQKLYKSVFKSVFASK